MEETGLDHPEMNHIFGEEYSNNDLLIDAKNVFASLVNIKYLIEKNIDVPQEIIDEEYREYFGYISRKHPDNLEKIMSRVEEDSIAKFNQLVGICNTFDWKNKDDILGKITSVLGELSTLYS